MNDHGFSKVCPSGNTREHFFRNERTVCEDCEGTGLIEADFEKVQDIVMIKAFGDKTWQQLHNIYRKWKENDEQIPCPECGSWEGWI